MGPIPINHTPKYVASQSRLAHLSAARIRKTILKALVLIAWAAFIVLMPG